MSVVFVNGQTFRYKWSKNFCRRRLYDKLFYFLQNHCNVFHVNVFVKKILRGAIE